MEVHGANESFQFDKLILTQPNSISGGSYLTKMMYKNSKTPLYIQTPKSKSKQGIVVVGRKAYIDLLLTTNDTDAEFIEWIDNLEKRVIELLHEKRHLWFTEELDRSDIENSLTSPIRAFRNGKNYLIRANLELNRVSVHTQPFLCQVFDENRHVVPVEYIKPDHDIMSIVEFQGIKFTSRSFQIELILRQVLVIPDSPLFDTCVIGTVAVPKPSNPNIHPETPQTHQTHQIAIESVNLIPNPISIPNPITEHLGNNAVMIDPKSLVSHLLENDSESNPLQTKLTLTTPENSSISRGIVIADGPTTTTTTDFDIGNNPNSMKHFEITEVDIDFKNISNTIDVEQPQFDNIDNNNNVNNVNTGSHHESNTKNGNTSTTNPHKHKKTISNTIWKSNGNSSITLKRPKDVLFQQYKLAKQKAKEAKKAAFQAYLEAKEIKAKYMLGDLDDSETESDSESVSDE